MVSFYVGDFKEALESCERWDIILLSNLLGTVQDWKEIYRVCFRNLNSSGILIHRELKLYIHPLDSLPPSISQFNTFLRQAAESAGTPLDITKHMQEQMKGQNFSVRANIDAKHPIPLGTWDHRRQYVMLGELSLARIHLDLEGLCLRMFKQLGWTAEMTKTFIDKVLEEIKSSNDP
ncbi:uncharacterized protein PV09_08036 [Verruconis gallopava]|uniref:Methyltransferase type 11 domain-containing protein n=1 Tax=Verruconis gallopava TaxID=253628 RepID=A0A0D2A0Y1_9PEZI|nr:uncharacterized protein PV09_08036 [Verruconis gallopava]KIW00323.1 hypothetical protein PV09_08036 [Verruconis gallopava]